MDIQRNARIGKQRTGGRTRWGVPCVFEKSFQISKTVQFYRKGKEKGDLESFEY